MFGKGPTEEETAEQERREAQERLEKAQKAALKAEASNAFASPTALAARKVSPRKVRSISPEERSESQRSQAQSRRIISNLAMSSAANAHHGSSQLDETSPQVASAVALANAAIDSARKASLASSPRGAPPPKQGYRAGSYSPAVSATPASITDSPPGAGGGQQHFSSSASVTPSVIRRTPSHDLDLKHNDNAFHVVANLVSERLMGKVTPGATSYTLDPSDAAYLDQMLPMTVRRSFVDALRYRVKICPPEGDPRETSLHVLTRRCSNLGLDRADGVNPLLNCGGVGGNPGGGSITVTGIPSSFSLARGPSASVRSSAASVASRARVSPTRNSTYRPPAGNPRSVSPSSRSVGGRSMMGGSIRKEHALSPRERRFQMEQEEQQQELEAKEAALKEQEKKLEEEAKKVEMERLEAQQKEMQNQLQRQQVEMQKQLLEQQSSFQQQMQAQQLQSMQQQQQLLNASSPPHSPLMAGAVAPASNPPTYGLDNTSLAGTLSGSLTEVNATTTENLARQQILSELKEAQTLMSDSVTPEAASFWKAHVAELQGRLRKLNNEPDVSPTTSSVTSVSLGSGQRRQDNEDATREKVEAHYGAQAMQQQSREAYLEANRQMTAEHMGSTMNAPVLPVAAVVHSRSLSSASKDSAGLEKVEVVAPADLPEGYTFEAQIGKKRFLATVPAGGVKKGEQFFSTMRELEQVQIEAPVGGWRDGLFDFAKHGISHPLLVYSLFLPLIALGQIMGRTRLDWLGNRTDVVTAKASFATMSAITIFWFTMNVVAVGSIYAKGAIFVNDFIALGLINAVTFGFFVYAVTKTRSKIRDKYAISGHGYEDLAYATFCGPCTVCQIGRHTADFDTYLGAFGTKTGLPENVELVSIPGASTSASYDSRSSHAHMV